MGRRPYKARVDIGTKRAKYTIKQDLAGKTIKENQLLRSFWSNHKMEDMIKLTQEQLDSEILLWMDEFEEVQKKRNRFWTWKEAVYLYDPKPKVKKEKKVNTSFNSTFVKRNMIE
jgi:hypothetical protein